ncbi:MAG: DUF3160 domain-containing protein [Victivallales bacterium]|nr:DUF3160 domain-containing protein [Victivallales bacterium]
MRIRGFLPTVLLAVPLLTFAAENPTTADPLPPQLQRDGIMITDHAYKQVFQAYLDNPHPFVTTDSILNAYQVLFEASLLQVETGQAAKLQKIVLALNRGLADFHGDNFKVPPELLRAALRRDRLIVGVAAKLLDPEFKLADPELEQAVAATVNQLQTGSGLFIPSWWGHPTPQFAGLDCQRFRPCGFYDSSTILQRYFQAVTWLQQIPFQVDSNEQLLAYLVLQNVYSHSDAKTHAAFFHFYRGILGPPDGKEFIPFISYLPCSLKNLDDFRKLLRKTPPEQINDTMRTALLPESGLDLLRILPARQTPDAILFAMVIDPRRAVDHFPSGLEVAAMLGSSFASEQLSPEQDKVAADAVTSLQQESLYCQYLQTLQTLFDPLPPEAPDFMRNRAWEIKSCNTVLAGWAQQRHAWTLQAKSNVSYRCLESNYSGLVEPNCAFWEKMAQLCRMTGMFFDYYQSQPPHPESNLPDYRKLLALLEKDDLETLRKQHQISVSIGCQAFLVTNLLEDPSWWKDKSSAAHRQHVHHAIARLIEILETKTLHQYPELEAQLTALEPTPCRYWDKLQAICLQLQLISLKQLHRLPFSDADRKFLKNYGIAIAHIMLYGDNSYLNPNDDAMRICQVFTATDDGMTTSYLEVGIGRARRLLVLYPTPQGKKLYTGAVLPYYEFSSPRPLTDAQWRQQLDSPERPAVPAWLKPIIAGGKLDIPQWDKKRQQ